VLRIAFEGEPLDRTLAGVAAGVGPRIVQSDRELAATRDTLSAYLEGDDDRLDLPVDFSLVGGPFRRAVLETLHREVHRGEVVTYGALARQAGNPRAVRATGTACATNPIPIVVPCHRVLPASGRLGNYGGGPERKRVLLTLEGAPVRG
jgi:methylated-DNA-[protein]-cysteine S-methyltransferase